MDVGCGPERITIDFAKIAVEGSVAGIDISPKLLAVTRSRFDEDNPDAPKDTASLGKLTFQKVSILDSLPFVDNLPRTLSMPSTPGKPLSTSLPERTTRPDPQMS